MAITGALTLALVAATAGQAWGITTVSRVANTVTIVGGDEVNYVEQVGYGDSGPLLYKDPGGIAYGEGCVDAGLGNTVECGTLGPGLVAQISLGGGDDTLRPEATITTAPRLVVDLGPGTDTTWGSAHGDEVQGGAGDDDINGRGGNDTLDGGEGNDRVSGAGADDTVSGGPGRDSLFGDGEFTAFNHGNDTLLARDGELDALSCEFGADSAVADAIDTFDAVGDCEQLDVGPGGGDPGGGDPGGGDPGGGALAVALGAPSGLKIRSLAKGRPLRFAATFSAACTASVGLAISAKQARRLKIGRKRTFLGRDAAAVPEPGTYESTLKISRRYRSKLRKAKRVPAVLLLVCVAADGSTDTASRNVVLR